MALIQEHDYDKTRHYLSEGYELVVLNYMKYEWVVCWFKFLPLVDKIEIATYDSPGYADARRRSMGWVSKWN